MKPQTGISKRFVAIAALLPLGALPLPAATRTFTSSTETAWNTAGSPGWDTIPATSGTVADRLNINGLTTLDSGTTLNINPTGVRALVIGTADGTPTTTYRLTVASGTLNLQGSGANNYPIIGAGTGASYAATSELVLSGGNVNVLNLAGDGTPGEIAILARGNSNAKGILTINNGSTLTADIVSLGLLEGSAGTGIINLNQGGKLKTRVIFERNNVASVQLNINGGTLVSNDTNNDEDWVRNTNGGAAITIGSLGATFDANGQGNQRLLTAIGGTGGATFTDSTGGGSIVLAANNSYAGTTTINSGARLVLGSSGSTGSLGTGAVTNNGTLVINRTDTITQSTFNGLSSGLSGSGALEKGNNGSFIADVANSHTGLTDVNTGVFRVTNAGAFGSTAGAAQVRLDGQIQLAGGITITGETLTLSCDGNAIFNGDATGRYMGGLHSASGTNTWAGSVIIGSALNSRLGAQNSATLRVTGTITAGGSGYDLIIRNGNTGTTELSGTGGSWANTRVYNGTLRLGANNTLAASARLVMGFTGLKGTLDMNGYNQAVDSLGDGSTVAADQTNELVTNNGSADSVLTVNTVETRSYGGVISDGTTHKVSLVKHGSGIQTLAGANTYSGSTTVSAGTLGIDGSTTGSAFTVGSAGKLAGFGTVNGTVDLTGKLAPGENGTSDRTLAINGNVTTNAGSLLSFRIDGAGSGQFDQLAIGAGSSIDLSGAALGITFADAGMDLLAPGEDWTTGASIYQIITGTTTGMFANATNMDLTAFNLGSSEYVWTDPLTSQAFWVKQGSISLVPIAIPEPGAALLGGLGLLALLRRRRDR